MMVAHEYEPATMKVRLVMKNVGIVTAFREAVGCTVPVLATVGRLHQQALEASFGEADAASGHALVRRRRKPT